MKRATSGKRQHFAAQTERRRTEAVAAAAARFVGEPEARRLQALVEEDRMNDPRWERHEGPAGKLKRMQECMAGRLWLEQHPNATWDDIKEAPL